MLWIELNHHLSTLENIKHIAILGGGPSGLFMFKRFVDSDRTNFHITIFERKKKLGQGMPYGREGANEEHITNVSSNEIPELVTPLAEWLKSVSSDTLAKYQIDLKHFNEYKVLPRLLFGQYLTDQFGLLHKKAREIGLEYQVSYNSEVTDMIDQPESQTVIVEINNEQQFVFDHVIICTGHNWPRKHEGRVAGYFDSPYPPIKLASPFNHAVAIKGSSLTAVDALRTLARHNGKFAKDSSGKLIYERSDISPDFRLVLHTRNGMLPAVRFHLDDSHLSNDRLLNEKELETHITNNSGFLSLDYIFEQDFKLPIKDKEPDFYEKIKEMSLEEFVDYMMQIRECLDPFQLLKAEYAQAEKSIQRKESIYWKEMLGVLSFAINYPAKYLSAEDMIRLQKTLAPLISIVIAYIPQRSSEEIMALHEAGILDIISVGDDSRVEAAAEQGATYHYIDESGEEKSVYFNTYVDCVGQPHFTFEQFPFKSLLNKRTVSPAKLKFQAQQEGIKAMAEGKEVIEEINGDLYLKVSGIAINDSFQIVDSYGAYNDRIYIMAVPYIGGYNPDYSGLDFSEAASAAIFKQFLA